MPFMKCVMNVVEVHFIWLNANEDNEDSYCIFRIVGTHFLLNRWSNILPEQLQYGIKINYLVRGVFAGGIADSYDLLLFFFLCS